jgi:hypothetical protein
MDDYDGIYNCNGLKCSPFEIFNNFWFILFYGDQNIGLKRTTKRTKPFSSCVVHLKGFSPKMITFFNKDEKGFGVSIMTWLAPFASNKYGPTSNSKSNYSKKVKQEHNASSRGKYFSLSVATLLWPSVGVKPNTWKKWGFGVLRDSQMFRVRQQGPKHLALRCSLCHWKGLEA